MANGPRLDQAKSYISLANSYGGFAESFVNGAGGLVVAFFTIAIGIGEAFANLIINPVDAFAFVTGQSIRAIFGGPARFLQSAWNTAAASLGMDPWTSLGPFVVVVAVLAAMIALGIVVWGLDAANFDTPTGMDLPFINLDEGGDQDDEQ
ncbi:hypothetical protein [Halobaculum sp. P14]|uniref:hypothetical protein n=1 Tax=Halobaculum sp. P14 TaxID=3421638 RepID=UPI003EBFE96D